MSTLKLYYTYLKENTKTQIPNIFINNNICDKCLYLLEDDNKYICPKCSNINCLNCLTKKYKLTRKIENKCFFCKEKFPDKIKSKVISDSYKFYFQCLNPKCNNCELYKYNLQIICKKCNKVYCSKCFKEIYPGKIETLIDDKIELIENINYETHTEEQKCLIHKCKNCDIKRFNFKLSKIFFCPLCHKIHIKQSDYIVVCNNLEIKLLIQLDFSYNIKRLLEFYKKDVFKDVLTNSLTFFGQNYDKFIIEKYSF